VDIVLEEYFIPKGEDLISKKVIYSNIRGRD
jgi:hypothetical protein